MPTTTNFGWTTPADTDLVKDGAAAIRTALGGVDTSFVDLKGGTTGQVLAKATNTDLDFVWSPLTAQKSFTLLSTTTTNTGSSFTISSLAGYDEIRVILQAVRTNDTGNNQIRLQMNGDTTSANYRQSGFAYTPSSSFSGTTLTSLTLSDPGFKLCNHGTNTSMDLNGFINIAGANKTTPKLANQAFGVNETGSPLGIIAGGYYSGTSVISNITLITAGGSFTSGTMYVYGAQ
jgi:hypothetical protein